MRAIPLCVALCMGCDCGAASHTAQDGEGGPPADAGLDAGGDAGCVPASAEHYRWSITFGAGEEDYAFAVATTRDATFVAGAFGETVDFGGGGRAAGWDDAFVARYDTQGDWEWDRVCGGPGVDSARQLVLGTSGNPVVAGTFTGPVDFGGGERSGVELEDAFVLTLGADSGHAWDVTIGSRTYDVAGGVAVGPDGAVVVAGTLAGEVDLGGGAVPERGGNDAFVVSYDSSGAYRWDARVGAAGIDEGGGVAIDDAGNAYVTGSFGGDVFVASFDAEGRERWLRVLAGGGDWDAGDDVAVSGDGARVVVAGRFAGTLDLGGGERLAGGPRDAFVLGLDGQGEWSWDHTFGASDYDDASSVAHDECGNVVAAGGFQESADFGGGARTGAGGWDAWVASWAPDGTWLWDLPIGFSDTQIVNDVSPTPGGVVVAGHFQGTIDLGGGPRTSAGAADGFVVALGD